MKERPILFSSPMVRAILDSRKSQTRRVMRSQPYTLRTEGFGYPTKAGGFVSLQSPHCFAECPYGVPGDRLYVKEATWLWCERRPNGTTKTGRPKWHYVPVPNTPAVYCADHPGKPNWGYPVVTSNGHVQMWKYKSARFMPRWASRITLEITDVRVQRVQEIDWRDAEAEGIDPQGGNSSDGEWRRVEAYKNLWDSINGKTHPWANNDWVWAVSFRRAA